MELSSNPFRDLISELRMLRRPIRALRLRGASWSQICRFWFWRVWATEGLIDGRTLWQSPEGYRLNCRREFVGYREVHLMDEYGTRVWHHVFTGLQRPLVLDVGANLGFFAALAHSLNPSSRLRCFEMIPACCDVIRRRFAEIHTSDGECIWAAVGAQHGQDVAVHYDIPFAQGNTTTRLTGRHQLFVPQVSLDGWLSAQPPELINAPRLVKIDVEGAEGDVVAGGKKCLTESDILLLELHGVEQRHLLSTFSGSHELVSDRRKSADLWVCTLVRRKS